MTKQGPGSALNDTGPGYVHSVAPDPWRLEPLDDTVRPHSLNEFNHFEIHLAYHGRGMCCDHRTEEILLV